MQRVLLTVLLFFTLLGMSQNKRDVIIRDSISLYQGIVFVSDNKVLPDDYQKVKKTILDLEKEYGYEPELKYGLLSKAYENNDIDFFKKELTILVRDYGFNYSYIRSTANYYKAISEGDLKGWFKEMYLKNHFLWMEDNFDKQQDLYVLNSISRKGLERMDLNEKIKERLELTQKQEGKLNNINNEFTFSDVTELYQLVRKLDKYPTAKNFALIQNSYKFSSIRNFRNKENIERFWLLFYPYYKKAYLNNEIDYSIFEYYDFYSYHHFGYQHFGLLDSEKIKNENGEEIPVKDIYFFSAIRKEFGWE